MKKSLIGTAIVLIIALGFGAVSYAYANTGESPRGPEGGLGGDCGKDGPLHDLFIENLADELGITSEELSARLDDGDKMVDILSEYGYEGDEIRDLLTSVKEESIEEALADGLISEEQAEKLQNFNGRRGPGGRRGQGKLGDGVLREYFLDALADTLGISVEELQEMHENGTKLSDLGYTEEEIQVILSDAKETAIQNAIDDGVITEEDYQNFQNRQQNRNQDDSSFGAPFQGQALEG